MSKLVGPLSGLAVVHLLTAFHFPWESEGWLRGLATPGSDLILLVGTVLALCFAFGSSRWSAHCLALGALLVPLYRFGLTVVPVFYGKPFDPYEDVLLVPGLIHLLTHSAPVWVQWALSIAGPVLLVGAYLLLYSLCRALLAAASRSRLAGPTLACIQVLLLISFTQTSLGRVRAERILGASVLGQAYSDLAGLPRFVKTYREFLERLDATGERLARVPDDLKRLEGADVYVIFVESYGRALLRKPEIASQFRARLAPLRARLEADGFSAVSCFLRPSVTGGGSGLAHAEFFSATPVSNKLMFHRLLKSGLKPLPGRFANAGYRAYNVMPAMPADWPESRSFFGFTEDLFQAQLPYDGFAYHWGRLPDQFALAQILERVVRPATQPLFVAYVSVASHAPFTTVPPLLSSFAEAVDQANFRGPPGREYDINWSNYLRAPDVEAAYLETVLYTLECVAGFAGELSRPSLLLVLGDHQPPAVGDLNAYDRSHLVPLHVISNRPELLLPYVGLGLQIGLTPDTDAPDFASTEFLPTFLTIHSVGPASRGG